MYIFQKSEPGVWTVGYFTSSGEWKTECECSSAADASQRAHWLNGGHDKEDLAPTSDRRDDIVH
jgi:hypothetical protein